ncbi:hypothetical protein WA026_010776 [Henosepilachna vigintioctopunctata]
MRLVNRRIPFNMKFVRMLSGPYKLDIKRCYEILEIPEGSNQDQIRNAYLLLVKKYHPDSVSGKANADKFYEVDKAFKTLCADIAREKMADNEENVEIHDIKHTAPQHRQYLNYDGYGIGNPAQREKQYTKARAIKASQNVFKYQVEKSMAANHALVEKKSLRHDIKTKYGIDRLVEDLIQESISKGDFNKLSGVGKPLKEKLNRNPYVDFITHKFNEILIDNGCTPEWITLNKEIREDLTTLRNQLREVRQYFKKYPLNEEDAYRWQESVSKYESRVKDLNSKIDKFNLVVPILNKQCFHINLKQEAQNILENGTYSSDDNLKKCSKGYPETRNVNTSTRTDTLFGFLGKLLQ